MMDKLVCVEGGNFQEYFTRGKRGYFVSIHPFMASWMFSKLTKCNSAHLLHTIQFGHPCSLMCIHF